MPSTSAIDEGLATEVAYELAKWFDEQIIKARDPLTVGFAMVSVGVEAFVQTTPDPQKIVAFAGLLRDLAQKLENGEPLPAFGHA